MKRFRAVFLLTTLLIGTMLVFSVGLSAQDMEASGQLEIFSWWTSGGEQAAVSQFAKELVVRSKRSTRCTPFTAVNIPMSRS